MGTVFKINDRVGLIDGTEKGIVTKIAGNKIYFETPEGFEMVATANKLVKYSTSKKGPVKKLSTHDELKKSKVDEPDFPISKKPIIPKVKDDSFKIPASSLSESKTKNTSKPTVTAWEIDLHIEEIIDNYTHLSNGEIVDIQIKYARNMLDKAKSKKIPKIIFIHGKGKGVLRSELHHLLSGYTHIEFYDASFKKYGGGATEVRLYSNK